MQPLRITRYRLSYSYVTYLNRESQPRPCIEIKVSPLTNFSSEPEIHDHQVLHRTENGTNSWYPNSQRSNPRRDNLRRVWRQVCNDKSIALALRHARVWIAMPKLKTNCRVHRQKVRLNKCADRDGHADCPSNDNKPTGKYRDAFRYGNILPFVTGGETI